MLGNKEKSPKVIISGKIPIKKKRSYIPIKSLQNLLKVSGININSDIFIIISFLITIALIPIGFSINTILGIVLPMSFLVIEYMILSYLKSKKMNNLYDQLESFIEVCCISGYTDITEFFGSIYQNYNGALRDNLEQCYIEAKQTRNKIKALNGLKEEYNLEYFNFCLDTLQRVKSGNGTYTPDFLQKQTKQKLKLIKDTFNTINRVKIDMCIITLCSSIVLSIATFLLGFDIKAFLFSSIGLPLIIVYMIIFLWGILVTYKE